MERVRTAGDSVESQCTRCKALLNHTIIALVAGKVARVKCNTCGSEHNHRPAKEPKVAVVKGAKAEKEKVARAPRAKSVKAPAISDEEIWEGLIRPLDPDLAIPYNMEGKFRANSLLKHPTFGIGMVSSSQTGKIEVVFKAGRKLLRSAC
jgi:hypothetical protein